MITIEVATKTDEAMNITRSDLAAMDVVEKDVWSAQSPIERGSSCKYPKLHALPSRGLPPHLPFTPRLQTRYLLPYSVCV